MGQEVCLALQAYRCGSSDVPVNTYLAELENNPELLEDNCSDSSGSDSDPSDDNLEIVELRNLYEKENNKKKLKRDKVTCRSESRSKREVVNRVLVNKNTMQIKEAKNISGITAKASSRKTIISSDRLHRGKNLVYFNANGKKVKDQATQTYRDDKGNLIGEYLASDRSTNASVVSYNDFEKGNENSFLLKNRNGLPSIGKTNKNFMNLVIGEKIRSKLL